MQQFRIDIKEKCRTHIKCRDNLGWQNVITQTGRHSSREQESARSQYAIAPHDESSSSGKWNENKLGMKVTQETLA